MGKKVDRLDAAVTRLIEALAEMTEKLANPLTVMHPGRFVGDAQSHFEKPLSRAGQTWEEINQVSSLGSGFTLAPEPVDEIPRGIGAGMDDPMAHMASEFAEMAAELDEIPPPPDETEVWEGRLNLYRGSRMWLPDWGPRPGQDGCLAPPGLLSR